MLTPPSILLFGTPERQFRVVCVPVWQLSVAAGLSGEQMDRFVTPRGEELVRAAAAQEQHREAAQGRAAIDAAATSERVQLQGLAARLM